MYKKRKNLIFILDGSDAKYLSSKLRIRQGRWIKENEALIQDRCLKHIYVINNPIVKFILQGIFLVQKPVVEYNVVSSLDKAYELAEERLQAEPVA